LRFRTQNLATGWLSLGRRKLLIVRVVGGKLFCPNELDRRRRRQGVSSFGVVMRRFASHLR
jgi:hypothetical protein